MGFKHSVGFVDADGFGYFPAPAKINLELRILGQRTDGYHELQTLFQLLDYGDDLWFKPTQNGLVELTSDYNEVPSEDNLVIRAARALQNTQAYQQKNVQLAHNQQQGVSIRLDKNLPSGAGLGGGSSDAATTLLALNHLWQLDMSNQELCDIGCKLGADVPVFVNGYTAWAEGVGEKLTNTELPEKHFLIIYPSVAINTAKIFSHSALTRNDKPIKLRATRTESEFEYGYNAMQSLVSELYPEVKEAISFLSQFGKATLTGTGSCVFISFDNEREVSKIAALCKQRWLTLETRGINTSPLLKVKHCRGIAKR